MFGLAPIAGAPLAALFGTASADVVATFEADALGPVDVTARTIGRVSLTAEALGPVVATARATSSSEEAA